MNESDNAAIQILERSLAVALAEVEHWERLAIEERQFLANAVVQIAAKQGTAHQLVAALNLLKQAEQAQPTVEGPAPEGG